MDSVRLRQLKQEDTRILYLLWLGYGEDSAYSRELYVSLHKEGESGRWYVCNINVLFQVQSFLAI